MRRRNNKSSKGTKEFTTLRIGKNGLSEEFITEAKEQIENCGGVRIKLPRGMESDEREKMAEEIASRTNTILLDRRGNIATLRKR